MPAAMLSSLVSVRLHTQHEPYRAPKAFASSSVSRVAADSRRTIPAAYSKREAYTGQRSSPSRSEEHTSELQSLMRISYAVFCLKKKNTDKLHTTSSITTP